MKLVLTTCFALLLLTACSKNENYRPGEYTEDWGMVGTIDGDSFVASSLNASLIYSEEDRHYTLNINGWRKSTNETILLSLKNFSYTPADYKLTYTTTYPKRDINYSFYRVNERTSWGNIGAVTIQSYKDSIVKGSFEFSTIDANHVKCVFAIKPHYSVVR